MNAFVYIVTWCLVMVVCDPNPNVCDEKNVYGLIPYYSDCQVFQYHYEKYCGFGEAYQSKDSAITFFKKLVRDSEFEQEGPYNQIVDIKMDSIQVQRK